MKTIDFVQTLKNQNFDFFTGVPCSLFTSLIHILYQDQSIHYVPAPREDSALGMAAGAFLTGKKSVVLMQNSGLGYCLNVLTSLNLIYHIPALIIVSWRGYLGKDAPEHIIMGAISTQLCEITRIPYLVLQHDHTPHTLKPAFQSIQNNQVFVIFLRKNQLQ